MRKSLVIIALLPVVTALSAIPGCRDRDELLSPAGPVGYLKLSVDFALDATTSSANPLLPEPAGISDPAGKHKAVTQGSSSALSAAISFMDAEVYDGSQGALLSLDAAPLNINWDDSSFSGLLTVEAGESRVVAVRAYTGGGGVICLGVETGITVFAGFASEVLITMKSYVPVISQYHRISQSGNIILGWSPIANATGYIVQESTRPDFATYDSLVVEGSSSASLSGKLPGEWYFRVLARGDFAVGFPSDTVSVRVTSVPVITILNPPESGSTVQSGEQVLFLARVLDEFQELIDSESIAWVSSIDGIFAEGEFTLYSSLSVGDHLITATVLSSLGTLSSDTVSLEVLASGNLAPEIILNFPTEGGLFNQGELILFLASGVDPEDGELGSESFFWFSSQDGYFGRGRALEYDQLSIGEHMIRVVGVDARGAAGTESAGISVVSSTGNQAPAATIDFPADGLSFALGTPILFAGGAVDPEEGTVPPERLQWYSSVSGFIGGGDYLVRSDLAAGEHRVVLLATDGQGVTGSEEVAITLESGGNQSPAVTITSPLTGAVFALGTGVGLVGAVTDPEDGALEGSALTWISSIDEILGTGASLVTENLSAGTHRIMLLAQDSRGAGAFDTISISLSNPPQVEIISPLDGSSYPVGTRIEFSGNASDPEEGVLPGSAMFWSSSLEEEPLGTGALLATRTLRLGTHRITLVAIDRSGLTDSAMVTIEVVIVPDTVISTVSVGSAPLQVAVDPLAAVAYLTNSGDNSLSEVELQDFTETQRIGVGDNPIGLAVSETLGRIYVANTSGDDLSVVEGGSVVQTIPVGFQPVGVAIDYAESLVFVSNSNAASISVISTAEGAVIQTIQNVGNSPGNLLISPAGNLLFVSNYGSRDVLDTSNDELAAVSLLDYSILRISVGDKPMGLASTSDGSLVFVANSGSNSVSIIRTADLQVVNDVAVGLTPTACAVAPDDHQLYVVNSAGADISVIDISSKTVIETIPDVGHQPYGIAIHQDQTAGRVLALVTDRALGHLIVLLVR